MVQTPRRVWVKSVRIPRIGTTERRNSGSGILENGGGSDMPEVRVLYTLALDSLTDRLSARASAKGGKGVQAIPEFSFRIGPERPQDQGFIV